MSEFLIIFETIAAAGTSIAFFLIVAIIMVVLISY